MVERDGVADDNTTNTHDPQLCPPWAALEQYSKALEKQCNVCACVSSGSGVQLRAEMFSLGCSFPGHQFCGIHSENLQLSRLHVHVEKVAQ